MKKHEASEEEDQEIKEMRNKISMAIRSNPNRNIGATSMVALMIEEFLEANVDKTEFLKEMDVVWDYYASRKKRSSYSSHKAKLVEKLFRGF
jgi:hypothetical protein